MAVDSIGGLFIRIAAFIVVEAMKMSRRLYSVDCYLSKINGLVHRLATNRAIHLDATPSVFAKYMAAPNFRQLP